ncbi:hypothetical protein DL96DRAFT_183672 [Flagelloscypha sp. PMI_526]|nr:hypothetical protein DL96DRAFT_183672 [Flagelloscypha sp. PMI_526]
MLGHPTCLSARLERLCEDILPHATRASFVNANTLELLSQCSRQRARSPYISEPFLNVAHDDVSLRLGQLNGLVAKMDASLKWLLRQQNDLQTARDTLRTLSALPTESFPAFPLDIAQNIIERAAEGDRRTAACLSLVSKQVQLWSDRQFYKHIVIQSSREAKLLDQFMFIQSPSNRLIRGLIETTLFTWDPSGMDPWSPNEGFAPILKYCPNLQSLYLWGAKVPILLPGNHTPLRLQRLSCPGELFHLEMPPDSATAFGRHLPDFTHPIFSHVTHLDIGHSYTVRWDWRGFRDLPALTHLHLDTRLCIGGQIKEITDNITPHFPPNLQICILHLDNWWTRYSDGFQELVEGRIHPQILVTMYQQRESEWVLLTEANGATYVAEFSKSGAFDESLWSKGMDILIRRNKALGIE